ncbi:hypothetical protein POPTR_017G120700v4 [Populus trichocarpa]|uniref:Uncharacterized protein n=1 Tax=Populus trichocarpa TaxID=3694 RepID=A0A2K1X6V6_POPTR|nr:hypothetical protein POPTR_017G120700v4 [Populus trichocarpa]
MDLCPCQIFFRRKPSRNLVTVILEMMEVAGATALTQSIHQYDNSYKTRLGSANYQVLPEGCGCHHASILEHIQ